MEQTRPLRIDRRGALVQQGISNSERILERPLRDVYCTDGLHQPWNHDKSCFQKQPYNGIVNAVHKSYTKEKTWERI